MFPIYVNLFCVSPLCKFLLQCNLLAIDLSYMRHNLKVKEADLVCSYMHEKTLFREPTDSSNMTQSIEECQDTEHITERMRATAEKAREAKRVKKPE